MRASQLDRLVTIEKRQVTVDPDYGSDNVVWVPLIALPGSPTVAGKLRAQIQDVIPSRSESVAQGLQISRQLVRMRIRYRSDITSDMRVIVHGDADVVHQIVGGPAMIGRKDWTECLLERQSS